MYDTHEWETGTDELVGKILLGWNEVRAVTQHPLLVDIEKPRFYFAHSYYVDPRLMATTAKYGSDFCAVVHRTNIVGTQFHPESG